TKLASRGAAMFCNQCGMDTGNDAPFCVKCGGRSIETVSTHLPGTATAAAPARYPVPKPQPRAPEPNLAVWVLLPILLFGSGVLLSAPDNSGDCLYRAKSSRSPTPRSR